MCSMRTHEDQSRLSDILWLSFISTFAHFCYYLLPRFPKNSAFLQHIFRFSISPALQYCILDCLLLEEPALLHIIKNNSTIGCRAVSFVTRISSARRAVLGKVQPLRSRLSCNVNCEVLVTGPPLVPLVILFLVLWYPPKKNFFFIW